MSAPVADFALAALATAYPDRFVAETLRVKEAELRHHAGLGPLLARLEDGIDALGADYLASFDAGPDRVPLYGTEYGRMRGLAKGNDLADISGFYQAFGWDLDADGGEMPDHLAVELEFYCILLYKAEALAAAGDADGVEIVADAQAKFLKQHLGTFVGAAARRVAHQPVYGPLLAWCAGLIAAECARLGVSPAPLDFFAQGDAEEVANCGGCVEAPGIVPLR